MQEMLKGILQGEGKYRSENSIETKKGSFREKINESKIKSYFSYS